MLTTVTTFILVYLLQYAGISSAGMAVVTIIITVAKIVDAITDPVMGALIDMTRTRWGKLRPYILFSAAPIAALTALMFSVPDVSEPLQLVYFGVVYLLWGFAYTVCDVPFWGLIGSAFPEPTRRTRVIGNVRAFGAISLGLATLGMPWLAKALSGGDETTGSGWSHAVLLISVVGMGMFLLAFFFTRERPSALAQGRLTFRQLGGTLIRNTPLLMVLLGSVLGFGRYIVQAGGAVFVVVAYGDEGLFTLIGAAIIVGHGAVVVHRAAAAALDERAHPHRRLVAAGRGVLRRACTSSASRTSSGSWCSSSSPGSPSASSSSCRRR